MNKTFKLYGLIWLIVFGVFNIIAFVLPKGGGNFWAGYIFITIAFLGQLACAYYSFKDNNLKKLFYNLPLFAISYSGLFAMLIAGGLCMAVPFIPGWLGSIVCLLILAFNIIAVIKAVAASEIVGGIDEKIKTQTFLIKSLTADAQVLMSSAKSELLRAETKRVYEAIRYPPMFFNSACTHPKLLQSCPTL